MSKDKNQWWAVKFPKSGILRFFARTRKESVKACCDPLRSWGNPPHWRSHYREGERCVKVWVYQEKRERNPIIRRRKDGHMMTVKDGDGSLWGLWVPPATCPTKVYPKAPAYDLDIAYKPLTKGKPHA